MSSLEQTLRSIRGAYANEAEQVADKVASAALDHGLLDVAYTTIDSPIGAVMVAATARGLVRVSFGESLDPEWFVHDLSARISPRVLEAPSYFDSVRGELNEYFEGKRRSFDLPLDWRLTHGFGRRVLQRTARIPYGQVSTYRRVAESAGSPRGFRAAGNALGSNPIPIIVPCHRVLASGGGLGGYGGGLELKRYLLRLEGAI